MRLCHSLMGVGRGTGEIEQNIFAEQPSPISYHKSQPNHQRITHHGRSLCLKPAESGFTFLD